MRECEKIAELIERLEHAAGNAALYPDSCNASIALRAARQALLDFLNPSSVFIKE